MVSVGVLTDSRSLIDWHKARRRLSDRRVSEANNDVEVERVKVYVCHDRCPPIVDLDAGPIHECTMTEDDLELDAWCLQIPFLIYNHDQPGYII